MQGDAYRCRSRQVTAVGPAVFTVWCRHCGWSPCHPDSVLFQAEPLLNARNVLNSNGQGAYYVHTGVCAVATASGADSMHCIWCGAYASCLLAPLAYWRPAPLAGLSFRSILLPESGQFVVCMYLLGSGDRSPFSVEYITNNKSSIDRSKQRHAVHLLS